MHFWHSFENCILPLVGILSTFSRVWARTFGTFWHFRELHLAFGQELLDCWHIEEEWKIVVVLTVTVPSFFLSCLAHLCLNEKEKTDASGRMTSSEQAWNVFHVWWRSPQWATGQRASSESARQSTSAKLLLLSPGDMKSALFREHV